MLVAQVREQLLDLVVDLRGLLTNRVSPSAGRCGSPSRTWPRRLLDEVDELLRIVPWLSVGRRSGEHLDAAAAAAAGVVRQLTAREVLTGEISP